MEGRSRRLSLSINRRPETETDRPVPPVPPPPQGQGDCRPRPFRAGSLALPEQSNRVLLDLLDDTQPFLNPVDLTALGRRHSSHYCPTHDPPEPKERSPSRPDRPERPTPPTVVPPPIPQRAPAVPKRSCVQPPPGIPPGVEPRTTVVDRFPQQTISIVPVSLPAIPPHPNRKLSAASNGNSNSCVSIPVPKIPPPAPIIPKHHPVHPGVVNPATSARSSEVPQPPQRRLQSQQSLNSAKLIQSSQGLVNSFPAKNNNNIPSQPLPTDNSCSVSNKDQTHAEKYIKQNTNSSPPAATMVSQNNINSQNSLEYSHGNQQDVNQNKSTSVLNMVASKMYSQIPNPMNVNINVKNNNRPPPLTHIHNNPAPPGNSKISVRQDSNVSSDSFSQTSSPSYTTKTMEAPLLPKSHCNGKIGGKLVNNVVKREDLISVQNGENNGNSVLTKSISTPASLQAIVRFHNGSNMSLHHRIIRDIRRTSNPYVTRGRLRFRFAQVLLNAIALLGIAGGFALYFRAYPAIQVVNKTITTSTTYALAPSNANNPAPGVCLPVIVNFCHLHRMPYNFTVFPNYIGHYGQREAQMDLDIYDAVVDVRCYELAALFLCSVFVPKCGPIGQIVLPCKSLCTETMRRCGFFLDVFGLSMPYLKCDLLPESSDTNICLGQREVIDAKRRSQKPKCPSGFQCDITRCIPADWRCDGHVDCADQTDELNCNICPKGTIHCGEKRCMAQSHMCDGIVDCPWGQDERNCLRLNESNGDIGEGKLEIFKPDLKQWLPACVSHWDATSPNVVCNMLGYSSVNSSRITMKGTADTIAAPTKDTPAMWRMFQKKHTNLLKEFVSCHHQESYATVDLKCTNYECGKTRQRYSIHKPSKRIVGGVQSSPGDWPFLAAILGGPEEVFYCAGVLIADQWVLTAAHCVGNHSDVAGWTIQLGITRRHSHSYYGEKVKVLRVIPHPLYNLEIAHDNDVALFQLSSRVKFHDHLLPVCLPPANKVLKPSTLCTVIGWGKREDKHMSEYEPAVNEVEVPVLHRDICNDWLEHQGLNVTEGMICAGYPEGGKDACQGDSGGPLLCKDSSDWSSWYVGGIVSWGIKCAHPRLPGVYAYVPRFVPWIQKQMKLYGG